MNISVIQPRLSVAQRANNLSILGRMIRQEARRTPAPDLIVLPDCCVATQETDERIEVTASMCQGFAEAFAWWAREWGVWIAVGHSTRVDHESHSNGGLHEIATLFDPDGDPYIRAWEPDANVSQVADAWTIRNTPIGRTALCSWNKPSMAVRQSLELSQPPDLVIIPSLNPNRAAIQALAKDCQCHAVFSACILGDSESDVQSFVADPTGQIIAETLSGKVSSTFVTVDVKPCLATDDEWEAHEAIE